MHASRYVSYSQSSSTRRQVAFHLTKQFTDPPPVIKASFLVNSYDGITLISGSYSYMEDYLSLVKGPCLETIHFGAKSMSSTPTHQVS